MLLILFMWSPISYTFRFCWTTRYNSHFSPFFFRPRLGQTLHKVMIVGGAYFILASVEGCMRVRDEVSITIIISDHSIISEHSSCHYVPYFPDEFLGRTNQPKSTLWISPLKGPTKCILKDERSKHMILHLSIFFNLWNRNISHSFSFSFMTTLERFYDE